MSYCPASHSQLWYDRGMDILNGFLNLIVGFLQALLNLLKAFFDLIVGFLQGILNLFT